MSKKSMKHVDLETLNQSNKKNAGRLLRRLAIALGLIAIFGTAGFTAYTATAGQEYTARYSVVRMDCPACASRIERALSQTPGVVASEVFMPAQTVYVTFHSKKTDPETLAKTIEALRFQVVYEGRVDRSGDAPDKPVALLVNGRPVFRHEVNGLYPELGGQNGPSAQNVFTAAASEALLQAMSGQGLLVNAMDLRQGVQQASTEFGKPMQQLIDESVQRCGSIVRYQQIFLQRIALRKYVGADPAARGKTQAWLADQLKQAKVEVTDPELKKTLVAEAGSADWNHIWPDMLAKDSDLRRVLQW